MQALLAPMLQSVTIIADIGTSSFSIGRVRKGDEGIITLSSIIKRRAHTQKFHIGWSQVILKKWVLHVDLAGIMFIIY